MKYKTLHNNGCETLIINDKPAVCPFRTPFLVPSGSIQGSYSIVEAQCNSLCPHFRLGKFSGDLNKGEVIISCGSKEETFIIENEPKLKTI